MAFRVGMGFDVHRLVENRELWIGGIQIPFEKGLDGHSDADVAIHAICDAILGAANMRDIGATGMREDHTLGNISLLANYGKQADVRMFTDYGVFVAVFDSTHFRSFVGQQVSIFNLRQENYIDADGLLYPIKHRNFAQWWEGTLNESTTNTFLLKLKGEVIVFQTYEKK